MSIAGPCFFCQQPVPWEDEEGNDAREFQNEDGTDGFVCEECCDSETYWCECCLVYVTRIGEPNEWEAEGVNVSAWVGGEYAYLCSWCAGVKYESAKMWADLLPDDEQREAAAVLWSEGWTLTREDLADTVRAL